MESKLPDLTLQGKDFYIPPEHKKGTDANDFASIDLTQFKDKLPKAHFVVDNSKSIFSPQVKHAICGE